MRVFIVVVENQDIGGVSETLDGAKALAVLEKVDLSKGAIEEWETNPSLFIEYHNS